MPVTLLLPGALLPREVARALAEPLAATALASLLARARLDGDSDADAPAHLAWLGEHLLQQDAPLPTAPYAHAALAGAPPAGDGVLWHADPVHLEVARDQLLLTPLPDSIPLEEADALIAAANALAVNVGVELGRVQDRWFLRATRRWDIATSPLAAAVWRPLLAGLPAGADAARWNRLLTEIQMEWHAHPVNEAREARGEPTVNSVWLHGGGTWAPLPRARFAAVLSVEPEWRGAAEAAGVPAGTPDDAPVDNALVVQSLLLEPRLLHDWTGWIEALRALDARLAGLARTTPLDLVLTGEATIRRLHGQPSDRLKFWRATSLEQVLSE